MPNPIKYTTGTESQALKKGNFYIGTGAVGKGPSDTTGYYQGPSVPSNGYVIYMNKVGAPGGLSYHSAANDSELISFTNSLAGESFTTAQQCFNYYYGQTDKVLVTQDYPADFPYIVLDGLVLYLDAGISQSYPGSGTVWTDINGLGPKNNMSLLNGPTFNSNDGGYITFDNTDDFGFINATSNNSLTNSNISMELWLKNPTGNFLLNGAYGNYFSNGFYNGGLLKNGTGSNGPAWTGTSIWQQWIAIWDQTAGQTRLYVNGILKGTSSNSRWDTGTGGKLVFGGGASINGLYSKEGSMDISIFRFYNKVLSESEITQNYNAQKGRFGL